MNRYAKVFPNAGGDTIIFTPGFASNNATNYRYQINTANQADKPYSECQYLIGAVTANVPTKFSVKIYLSDIYDTILSLDKDLIFGDIMQLQFTLNPLTSLGFYGTAASPPVLAAAPNLTQAPMNIQNITLYLATETNQIIIDQLRNKLNEGLPILYSNVQTFSASQNSNIQSISFTVPSGRVLTLDRIYYSIFTTNQATANLPPVQNDIASTLVSNFQTSLDNQPLTPYPLIPPSYMDYDTNKKLLEGSSIMSGDINNYNWCWIQDFCNGTQSDVPNDNTYKGIPIHNRSPTYAATVYLTAANNNSHYCFVVTKEHRVINNGMSGRPLIELMCKPNQEKTINIYGHFTETKNRFTVPITDIGFIPNRIELKGYSIGSFISNRDNPPPFLLLSILSDIPGISGNLTLSAL
ncbi:hypothetical protein ACTFIT_008973 [Dictyostelium discoideum]